MDDALTNHIDLIQQLGSIDQRYLWVSMIWGAIASGYCIYGFKQKEIVPCLGGFAMTAATFLIYSSLWLSVAGIIIIVAVWWLMKQGY